VLSAYDEEANHLLTFIKLDPNKTSTIHEEALAAFWRSGGPVLASKRGSIGTHARGANQGV
jgi:hypothetical protein